MAVPVILQRSFSSVIDNRIKLSNGQVCRLWSSTVGTTWTTIRVGVRMSIQDSGANIISSPVLAIGISSGTTNLFMDATTNHWFGIVTNEVTWTRTAGTPVYYPLGRTGYANDGPKIAKRIGTTTTVGATLGPFSQSHFLMDASTANRALYFLTITKSPPNFSLQLFACTNPAGDVSLATFQAHMEYLSPAVTNHSSGSATTLAVDEATNGYFNAVNIGWDRTTPAIEISDIAVVKFA